MTVLWFNTAKSSGTTEIQMTSILGLIFPSYCIFWVLVFAWIPFSARPAAVIPINQFFIHRTVLRSLLKLKLGSSRIKSNIQEVRVRHYRPLLWKMICKVKKAIWAGKSLQKSPVNKPTKLKRGESIYTGPKIITTTTITISMSIHICFY